MNNNKYSTAEVASAFNLIVKDKEQIPFSVFTKGFEKGTPEYASVREAYNTADAILKWAEENSASEDGTKRRFAFSAVKADRHRSSRSISLAYGTPMHLLAENIRETNLKKFTDARAAGLTPKESGLDTKTYLAIALHNNFIPAVDPYKVPNEKGRLTFTKEGLAKWLENEEKRIVSERAVAAEALKKAKAKADAEAAKAKELASVARGNANRKKETESVSVVSRKAARKAPLPSKKR